MASVNEKRLPSEENGGCSHISAWEPPNLWRGAHLAESCQGEDGSTAFGLFVLDGCGSSFSNLPRAEQTFCIAVSASSRAACLAIRQRGLVLPLWVLFFDLIFHHGVPSTVSEIGGLNSRVRMVGCTTLQSNPLRPTLSEMRKGARMQAVLRGRRLLGAGS
jgi:hypothetical protein